MRPQTGSQWGFIVKIYTKYLHLQVTADTRRSPTDKLNLHFTCQLYALIIRTYIYKRVCEYRQHISCRHYYATLY
jgi:hypothetical protein